MLDLQIEDPDRFADTLAAPPASPDDGEAEAARAVSTRSSGCTRLNDLLEVEIEKLNIDRRINDQVKKQMEKAQKEYYLNEKIKAIHEELGRKDEQATRSRSCRRRSRTPRCRRRPRRRRSRSSSASRAMPPVSAEATVSRNYIDWLLAVPWKKASREIRDIKRAEKILDEDHYGLEKVKERILEFLAVRQLVEKHEGLDPLLRRAARASARPRSPSRSRAPPAASSCACRSAACATRPRSAATAAPTSARSPARSSR